MKKVAPFVKGRVLSLGYPDLVVSAKEAQELLGELPRVFLDNGKWHQRDYLLPDTEELFKQVGASLECVDIVKARGMERIADLNYPQELGSYDLVIDPGTIEHCFNIAQALINAANAVAYKGHIFHVPPLTQLNHGFYCTSPTLFYDFYTQNGWTVDIDLCLPNGRVMKAPHLQRFGAVPECYLMVLAQRLNNEALKFPIQTKYRLNPTLKAA